MTTHTATSPRKHLESSLPHRTDRQVCDKTTSHEKTQLHQACRHCNLCAINTFKARPRPPPPTHPNLPTHFSIFPFPCSCSSSRTSSVPSSPHSAGVDCSRSYPGELRGSVCSAATHGALGCSSFSLPMCLVAIKAF